MSLNESKRDLLKRLRGTVLRYDEVSALDLVKKALEAGLDPKTIITMALMPAMKEVGSLFGQEKMFIPEVMCSAEVFNAVMLLLKPKIVEKGERLETLGKVVIGTVARDIHDLGKNLTVTMLTMAGFEVVDLGKDIPTEVFVQKVRELKPDILAMSSLMTTTMLEQRGVVEALKREGLRDKVKVMVGGAPVTPEWAREIGADGYSLDAFEAAEVAKKLVKTIS